MAGTDIFRLKSLGGCKPKSPEFRFHESYIPEPMSGCWLWVGTERGSNGYGALKIDGIPKAAHRYSYELHKGPVPDNAMVCHRCDVPSCVNPSHLFLGDASINSKDKVNKGRQARGAALAARQAARRAAGERNGNSKLTRESVDAIRAMGAPQRSIAQLFGVSQAIVSKIKRNEVWK